jgi:hypothetical protein
MIWLVGVIAYGIMVLLFYIILRGASILNEADKGHCTG